MTTPNLQLPEVPQAILTASDELNAGLWIQDAVVQLSITSRTALVPPSTALQGSRYIIPSDAGGEWENRVNHIAYRSPLGWIYIVPRPGWIAVALDESPPAMLIYHDNAWNEIGSDPPPFDEVDLEIEPDGSDFLLIKTADSSSEYKRITLDSIGSAIGGSSGGVDTRPDLPSPMNDEFDEETLDVKWTWFNQGDTDLQLQDRVLTMQIPYESAINVRGIDQPISGAAVYRAKISGIMAANYNLAGIGLRNSSNGRIVLFDCIRVGETMAVTRFNSATSLNGDSVSPVSRTKYGGDYGWGYFELEDNGTTLTFKASASGAYGTWVTIGSETRAAFLGTPTHVGIYGISNSTANQAKLAVEWFRVTAVPATPVPTVLFEDTFSGSSVDAAWSWINQGSATANVASGMLTLTVPGNNDGQFTGLGIMSAGKRRYRLHTGTLTAPNNHMVGLAVRDTNDGEYYMLGKHQGQLAVLRFNNSGYVGTDVAPGVISADNTWLEIHDRGPDLVFGYSTTGVNGSFTTVATIQKSSFIDDVTQVMIGVFDLVSSNGVLQALTFQILEDL